MHAITSQGSSPLTPQGSEAVSLHVVTPVATPAGASADAARSSANGADQAQTTAVVVGPDSRSLEVHYEFDRVANLWVANLLDASNGEVVRTVPATRILHQLAELTHPHVDARA